MVRHIRPVWVFIATVALTVSAATLLNPGGKRGFAQVAGLQAPGSPIFDCAGDQAAINRLQSGLPVQDEAIRRTEAALEIAKEDAGQASEEARQTVAFAAVKLLNYEAKNISDSAQALIAQEGAVRSAGITADEAARFKFFQNVKSIADLSNKLMEATDASGDLAKSYAAGKAFGSAVTVQNTGLKLSTLINQTNKLLQDSGINDKAAEELSAKIALAAWGPIGEAGVHGLVTAMDLAADCWQATSTAGDVAEESHNLEVMKDQYRRAKDRIYELQQEIAVGCKATPQQTTANTSNAPGSSEVSKPTGGSHAGLWILGGVLGAGGAGAYAAGVAMKNQNANSSSSSGGQVNGHCDGAAPSNACGACTCTPDVNCGSSPQCGGDDCWTSSSTPPLC